MTIINTMKKLVGWPSDADILAKDQAEYDALDATAESLRKAALNEYQDKLSQIHRDVSIRRAELAYNLRKGGVL